MDLLEKDFWDFWESWVTFRDSCEKKAKGKAIINGTGWRKLKDFHTERYLRNLENPHYFLFKMKMEYPEYYRDFSLGKFSNRYSRRNSTTVTARIINLFNFPSWRK